MANDTKKKSAKVRLEDAFTPKASISKKAYALLAVLSFVLIFILGVCRLCKTCRQYVFTIAGKNF